MLLLRISFYIPIHYDFEHTYICIEIQVVIKPLNPQNVVHSAGLTVLIQKNRRFVAGRSVTKTTRVFAFDILSTNIIKKV